MRIRTILAILAIGLSLSVREAAAEPVPAPDVVLGHPVGADYQLADYGQLQSYWRLLAARSDRVRLVDIGPTEQGRRQLMAVVSSPENLARLDEYRQIAGRLSQAEGLTAAQADALASRGKAIVWIDGGLHATEVAPSQALFVGPYDLASRNDPETLRLLQDVIVLFAQANPDGQDMVSRWYMRQTDPTKREFKTIPDLYHKYAGHDINRDFYMSAMKETANINRVLFRSWHPQIIYNQHQTGPEGTVVFLPPFRDPFNYNYDPLVVSELAEVGAAMHSRLIAEGKPGSTMRTGANFSTWFNGSERTTAYFHNAVGLLSEIIGNPTPTKIPLIASKQLAHSDLPAPVPPQVWRMTQTIDYTLSLNRAVIDYASRNRERLLRNSYEMGARAIARGRADSWTVTPKRIAALQAKAPPAGGEMDPVLYQAVLHAPDARDARAYILPSDQTDFPTAVVFANALIRAGVRVEQAPNAFEVEGRRYPARSLVVRTDQAYRAHVLDMFEPQDHPTDLAYPGGPPVKPYDAAGYTLALQMNVEFVRAHSPVTVPLAVLSEEIPPPERSIRGVGDAGFLVDHRVNNSFILTNRLLKAHARVAWLRYAWYGPGGPLAAGALWVPNTSVSRPIVIAATRELGLRTLPVAAPPPGPKLWLKAPRIALADTYGGLVTAGWTRWLLEKFEFPYETVYPAQINAGALQGFDVLLLTNGALKAPNAPADPDHRQPDLQDTPADLRNRLGILSDADTGPGLERFVRQGGSVVAIGSSTRVAAALGAAVSPEPPAAAGGREEIYIPGSLLQVSVDSGHPLGFGMPERATVFFDQSPVLRQRGPGLDRIAWYADGDVLRSGWAMGAARLADAEAVVSAKVGLGRAILIGPEVAQRAQSYGTFKLLFNALFYGSAQLEGEASKGPPNGQGGRTRGRAE